MTRESARSDMPSPFQIVIAEDNPADVMLVRRALDEHAVNYDLRVLSDGEDVVSFVNGLDEDSKIPCPDLLLLDLYLPKRDGNEVLTHLRASQRCGQIPVVVLTSSDATWDRENAAYQEQPVVNRAEVVVDLDLPVPQTLRHPEIILRLFEGHVHDLVMFFSADCALVRHRRPP